MINRKVVDLASELALVALTVAVTFGFERIFTDRSFLPDLLLFVLAAHGLAIVARRAGFSTLISVLISAAGFVIVANVVLFPETAGSVLPTRETFSLLRADLDVAWQTFSAESAPVDALRGFVVVAAVALWWTATLADWAAFRLRSTLEAVAPAATIFVFVALLGAGQSPVLHATLFATAAGVVILTMRAERQAREEVWIASGTSAGLTTTMRVGTAALALSVAFGVYAGPAFPDAGDVLLDPSTWDNGPQTRSVVSPLVDIHASLVDQSRFEMFSVKVDNPDTDRSYWRLMALTEFNGQVWSRSSNFDDIRGPVGSDVDPSIPRRLVRQEITTRSLGGIYLPAAYEVNNVISSQNVALEYEVATGALVVQRESEAAAARGFTYMIESAVPNFSPGDLPANAADGLDPEFVEPLTALPPTCSSDQARSDGCWSGAVTQLAEEITAGATSDYQRALSLQQYFLSGSNFTYDLDVALRHDVNSIEDFLFTVKRGYCEQFAVAFAGMARSLGIPARVAVGFTWGDWNESRKEFVVRGEHAHTWPELYFAGVGWVVFDPTPGRAPANNSDITGLAPAQLNFNDQANRSDSAAPDTVPNTLAAPRPTGGGAFIEPESVTTTLAASGGTGRSGGLSSRNLLRGLAATSGLALALGAIPLAKFGLTRRRLARVVDDPYGRSEIAWDDAAEAMAMVGVAPVASETALEFSRRAALSELHLGPTRELASALTILRYAQTSDAPNIAAGAVAAAEDIVTTCRAQVPRRRLVLASMDPRRLRPV